MKRYDFLLFVILFFAFNAQFWFQNSETFSKSKFITPQSEFPLLKSSLQALPSIQYEEHDPISIDGNSDFSNLAMAEGWPGDGTASKPYVIEGLNITSITIKNTNAYFQISNCIFVEYEKIDTRINIDNAVNGNISNNIITGNIGNIITGRLGIVLSGGGRHIISDNTILGSLYFQGIEVSGSEQNNISNNIISYSSKGMLIDNSDENIIVDNSVFNNLEGGGIELKYADNNLITNNNVSFNERHGIRLYSGSGNSIINNSISHNEFGLMVEFSDENTIINNSIYNNSDDGMHIVGNEIVGHEIANNNVSYNSENGIIFGSDNSNITNNSISHNGKAGIQLGSASENNVILFNKIVYNNRYGITLSQFHHSVKWNVFIGNNIGGLSQAYDPSFSIFSFNYWNDWTSPDDNADGIVDVPYPIDGDSNNKDPYPLAVIHYLSKPTIIYPNGGETLSGTVTIRWNSSIDMLRHHITHAVYFSSDGGTSWILLYSGLKTTTYDWDTTTVRNGSTYLIKVSTTCSEALTTEDASDSNFTITNVITTLSTQSTERSSEQTSFTTGILSLFAISMIMWLMRKRKKL